MRNIRRLAILVSPLLLTCCASGSLPAPQVAVPHDFTAPQGPSLDVSAIDRWWLQFHDQQLDSLVEQALNSAPDARTALARLREAEAVRRGALTPYDPQGNPTFSVSRTDERLSGLPASEAAVLGSALGAGKSTAGNGAFNVSWELDLLGRRAAARKSANADLASARFDFEATRISLAASVATGLFNARGLAAQIVEAEETLRIAQDLARVGQLRVTSGLGSASDAARLDTDVANARSDLTNLRAQLAVARRNLLVLLGQGTATPDTLPVSTLLPSPPRPPAMTPADLMVRRPDVREAEQNLVSATGQVRLDRLALFPRLTLEPGASLTRVLTPLGYTESVWTLAAGLFVPILDRARLLSELGAQTARGQQAVIAYEHAVQAAYGDAENSLTTLSADLARLDDLTEAERRSRFAFDAQQKGYKAGIVDLDTLLQTEQSWRSARIALVGLRTSTLSDAVTCFKALGGGWTPNEMSGKS